MSKSSTKRAEDSCARNSIIFLALATYSKIGGLQNFNRRLLSNLAKLSDDGTVSSYSSLLMDDQQSDIPDFLQRNVTAFGRDRLKFIFALFKLQKSDQLFLGHINLLPIAVLLRVFRPSTRVTLFVHGDDVWNDELRPRRFYEPFMLRFIDRIAAVSAYTAAIMAREYRVPAQKFTIYPNAIDNFETATTPAPSVGHILCVTRLGTGDRRKNVDQLIRAIGLISSRGLDLHLSIVGEGSLRKELEQLVGDLNLSRIVEFKGRLSDCDLAVAYSSANIFALLSSKEGFGIVYLEAWSYALPVICSKRGAPSEIVTNAVDGYVVDDTSVEDIAEKLTVLLEDPSLGRRMGLQGLEKVKSTYLNSNAINNLAKLVLYK